MNCEQRSYIARIQQSEPEEILINLKSATALIR